MQKLGDPSNMSHPISVNMQDPTFCDFHFYLFTLISPYGGTIEILSSVHFCVGEIPNKEFCSDDSGDFSANGQAKIDTSGCDSNQENLPKNRDICSRKASKAVKRTKRCEDAIVTSTSEVTDMNGNNRVRRTRRKKV